MSQIQQASTVGPPPPSVATTYTADDATTATPALNNLNVYSSSTYVNNENGIQSTASGSTVVYELTNRVNSTDTTTDATTTTVGTFALTGTGTWLFEGEILAYNQTSNLGAGYKLKAAARATAGAGTEISTEVTDVFEEGAMVACTVEAVVAANTFKINVTGYGAETIKWHVFFTYSFVDGS